MLRHTWNAIRYLWWPLGIVADLALVRLGAFAGRTAFGLVALVEAIGLLIALIAVARAAGRIRGDLRGGVSFWDALEAGLTFLFPPLVARAIALEPRVYVSIARWIARRPPPAPNRFGYHRASVLGVFLIAMIFTTPIEILIGELLIPWSWLRLAVLILALYGCLWVVGLYASLVTMPHIVGVAMLDLRYGILGEIRVPFDAIAALTQDRRSSPNQREGLAVDRQGTTASLSIGGQTQVRIALRQPVRLRGLLRDHQITAGIDLAVDDPRGFVAAVRAASAAAGVPVAD